MQGSIAISRRTETKTEYIAIDDCKKLVAGEYNKYDDFKDINRFFIKMPLQELNDKTSITAKTAFKVHTNSIEGFWSLLKRGINGTYHWVSKKHHGSYVREFEFIYNNREPTACNKMSLCLGYFGEDAGCS